MIRMRYAHGHGQHTTGDHGTREERSAVRRVHKISIQGNDMTQNGTIMVDRPHFTPDAQWRAEVPERFQRLPELITMGDMREIFGFSPAYLRRLRSARLRLDARGETGDAINALPRALDTISRRPLHWRTSDVLLWGIQTGRLDGITGAPMSLSGRKPAPKS